MAAKMDSEGQTLQVVDQQVLDALEMGNSSVDYAGNDSIIQKLLRRTRGYTDRQAAAIRSNTSFQPRYHQNKISDISQVNMTRMSMQNEGLNNIIGINRTGNRITHGVTNLQDSNESLIFDANKSKRMLDTRSPNPHTKSCRLVSLSIEKTYKPTYFDKTGSMSQTVEDYKPSKSNFKMAALND